MFDIEEPGKLSLTPNAVGEKFVGITVNDVVVPNGTVLPGASSAIVSFGPIPTRTDWLAEALCPDPSEAYTVMVWSPLSATSGVQKKTPDESIFTLETEDPPIESPTE